MTVRNARCNDEEVTVLISHTTNLGNKSLYSNR